MCVIAMGHRLPVTDSYEKKMNANHFFKDLFIILFIFGCFGSWLRHAGSSLRRAGSSL